MNLIVYPPIGRGSDRFDENTLINTSRRSRIRRQHTMRKLHAIGLSILLLTCATPLLAQDGCIDSPENPTVILALVGSAGALLSTWRFRYKR